MDEPPPPVNTRHMVTRSKSGVFKPRVYGASLFDASEPHTFREAQKHPAWVQAMSSEYNALLQNKTWSLVPAPTNIPIIGCKWVFKLKTNPDGSIARHKARLVAKGYSQTPGLDYTETFSPDVKPTTIRIVLTIAASRGWIIKQLDVNNALLNGSLHEVVFMQQPPGFEVHNGSSPLLCRLHKALYGLKQAPRAWFEKLRVAFQSMDFVTSRADSSLFIKFMPTYVVYILVYVDDIVMTGSDLSQIQQIIHIGDSIYSQRFW